MYSARIKEFEVNFKFSIEEEVHHRGYRKNLIINRQILFKDYDSEYIAYDVYVVEEDGLRSVESVPEFWLEKGHRVE